MTNKYWYRMLRRPISIGCQPKGFVATNDSIEVHGIVAYDRKLTVDELEEFEMSEFQAYSDLEVAEMLTDIGYDVELDNDNSFNTSLTAEMAVNEGYKWDEANQLWHI